MSHISYHGTKDTSADMMLGPPSKIDVNVGKGELGKGFYTGSSVAIAAIWARQRYGNLGVVIEFNIPIPRFVQLDGFLIRTNAEVINNWAVLKARKETAIFVYGHDYILAPFARIEETGHQFKFESQKAQNELNDSKKQIFPCAS